VQENDSFQISQRDQIVNYDFLCELYASAYDPIRKKGKKESLKQNFFYRENKIKEPSEKTHSENNCLRID
jgi:hypothetical protein